MKKTIALLTIFALCLGLCACGGTEAAKPEVTPTPEPTPNPAEVLYEKYAGIFDALEAEDYDGAIAQISEMKPAPEIVEVTITPENFYDYYEICYREPMIDKNAQGEIVEYKFYSNTYSFQLKEEYIPVLIADKSNVEIGVQCEYDVHHVDSIDWATGTVVLSDKTFDNLKDQISKTFTTPEETSASSTETGNVKIAGANAYLAEFSFWHKDQWGWSNGKFPTPASNDDYYIFMPVDITIVRAEGQLVFQN